MCLKFLQIKISDENEILVFLFFYNYINIFETKYLGDIVLIIFIFYYFPKRRFLTSSDECI